MHPSSSSHHLEREFFNDSIKSLHNMKQASLSWFHKLSFTNQNIGFKKSRIYYSLFIKILNNSFTAILLYIDYIVKATSVLKKFLSSYLKIKDLGPMEYFLRMLLDLRLELTFVNKNIAWIF
jgi:ribosomal protein S18